MRFSLDLFSRNKLKGNYIDSLFDLFCENPNLGAQKLVENIKTLVDYLRVNPLPFKVYKKADSLPPSFRRNVRAIEVRFEGEDTMKKIANEISNNFWPEVEKYELIVSQENISLFDEQFAERMGDEYRVFMTQKNLVDFMRRSPIEGYRFSFTNGVMRVLGELDGELEEFDIAEYYKINPRRYNSKSDKVSFNFAKFSADFCRIHCCDSLPIMDFLDNVRFYADRHEVDTVCWNIKDENDLEYIAEAIHQDVWPKDCLWLLTGNIESLHFYHRDHHNTGWKIPIYAEHLLKTLEEENLFGLGRDGCL